MGVPATDIDDYLRGLGARLHGPGRLRRDLLAEARDSLQDAAGAYLDGGLAPRAAQRRAVAEFGTADELAPAYQAEIAATTARTLALRIVLVTALQISAADLMWQGAPWTGDRPPVGYLVLSASLDLLWIASGLLAAAAWLGLRHGARRPGPGSVRLSRVLGRSMVAVIGLAALGGITIYGWSVMMWDAALGWPPMMIGLVAIGTALTWLAGAAHDCLAGAR